MYTLVSLSYNAAQKLYYLHEEDEGDWSLDRRKLQRIYRYLHLCESIVWLYLMCDKFYVFENQFTDKIV